MQSSNSLSVTPPPELIRFAERQVRKASAEQPAVERRSEPRRYLVAPVIVQRVDGALQPVGLPLPAVTRDLSQRGVGLIFASVPKHDRFAIAFDLDGNEICLLVEAHWRKQMGPFEYVGCRVIEILEALPEPQP